jgi:predicted aspartyl protease
MTHFQILKYAGILAFALNFLSANVAAQEAVNVAIETPEANPAPALQQFLTDTTTRMTVSVRINESAEYPFIVDTGSERTVIANELAQLLGLQTGEQLRLATVSGPAVVNSYQVNRLTTDTVRLDNIIAPGLDRDNLGAYGLLGIDSLQDKRIDFDLRAGTMNVLPAKADKEQLRSERGLIVVSARRKAGRLILSDAKVNGRKVDIIIDTGTQSSLGNQSLRDILLSSSRKGGFQTVSMQSVTGKLVPGDFTQIRNIEISGLIINNLPITFSENYAMKALDLEERPAIFLGMDAIRLFDRVIIDFANRRISFGVPRGARRDEILRLAGSN